MSRMKNSDTDVEGRYSRCVRTGAFPAGALPSKVGLLLRLARRRSIAFDWSFVDDVFCICLQDRDDRFRTSADEFHRVGLCSRVVYLRPQKATASMCGGCNSPGTFGNWESHKYCCMLSLRNRSVRCLVFEDDVEFLPRMTPAVLRRVAGHLKSLRSWDVYYLGHLPLAALPVSANLTRTVSLMTHSYIVNRPFMRRVVRTDYVRDRLHSTAPLEAWFMRYARNYAHYPGLTIQSLSKSDVGGDRPGIRFFYRHHDALDFAASRLVPGLLLVLVLVFTFAFAAKMCKRAGAQYR